MLVEQPQLNDRRTPLLIENVETIMVPNSLRECRDVICAVLFVLFFMAFLGLLIYGIVTGNYLSVVSIYNSDLKQCNTMNDFYFGYVLDLNNLQNAVCVTSCPTTPGTSTSCYPDNKNCIGGTFTPTYSSFSLDSYCLPNNGTSVTIQSLFSGDAYQSWMYDMETAWVVLVCAAGAAILLSILFFAFVRICAGFIIWLSAVVAIGGLIVIGVFFILTAKGVVVDDFVFSHLSTFSYNTLIITGSIALGGAFIIFLLVLCLHSRLTMGIKAVELGSIFLFDNCCMIFLPITQVFFILATICALIFGAGYLYSQGTFTYPNTAAFPTVTLNAGDIAMISVFFAASIWLIFFFHGCNHYILCSSVAVWYFNQEGTGNSPCGQSLHRLMAFNLGSVAITSLINGIFFVIKIIAHIFSFDNTENDNHMVTCCLKCLNALFCICKVCLKFLSDGAYVQMAITGKGYCSSTMRASELLLENVLRVGITDGIAIFFTIIGVIGVSAAVAVSAYFSVWGIPYYQARISSPFSVTFVSGLIAFIIASVYLSMIDISATSVLQCFLTDRQRHNGKVRFANEQLRSVLLE